jgi:hypothetical protein
MTEEDRLRLPVAIHCCTHTNDLRSCSYRSQIPPVPIVQQCEHVVGFDLIYVFSLRIKNKDQWDVFTMLVVVDRYA